MKNTIARLIEVIRRKAMISAIVAFSLFLVTAALMKRSGECLKTPSARWAIVSLELAFTNSKASEIKREWDSTPCATGVNATSMAIKNTNQDLLFIIGYTSLLVVFSTLVPHKRGDGFTVLLIQLAFVAGFLDVIENVGMLAFLNGQSIHPVFFGAFAAAKFLVIIFVLINIFSGIIRKFLNASVT